jgi:tRNA(fMet)-specific endonuclease VapC
MILFDTDTLTLLHHGNPRVQNRVAHEADIIAITVISRIEVLMGRFEFMLKATDGEQWLRAQKSLSLSDRDLANHRVILVDVAAAAEFDRLRHDKKLKIIGRRDMLIACIALAQRAKLITRNLKHFRLVPGLTVENWAD